MQDSNPVGFVFSRFLDARFLDELFEGDTSYAQIVFEDFLRDLPDYWKDVQGAYENQDINGLRTSIHKCKTLFGYVGFSDIQQLCQDFENNCSGQPIAALGSGYSILLAKKEQARQVIEDEYERLKLFNASGS
jgi:HPt (histidine-containing phosphotransfer) domain-containing protein